jgi:hypothetical protein
MTGREGLASVLRNVRNDGGFTVSGSARWLCNDDNVGELMELAVGDCLIWINVWDAPTLTTSRHPDTTQPRPRR